MKITCDVIQDLMPSYIDGILSEDSRALVEEHMGTCQECRKMLEIMKEEQGKEQARIRSSVASVAGCGTGGTENTESNANTGSVAALKKIRRKLIIRRVLTAACGSYPDTHRCGSRLQSLVFQRKIHDPGK